MTIIALGAAAWSLLLPQQGKLSMDEALRIAVENSFSLKISASNVEKTRQKIKEAKGTVGPKLTAQGTYTRFDQASTANIGGNTVTVSPIDQKQAQLVFSMPLDLTGVIGRGISAARASEQASLSSYEATKNDVRLTVKNAYFGVLQTMAFVDVQKEALTRAETQLKNARIEFEKGSKAKVDVLRFETFVSQAKADLITAENSLSLAKSAFNNALGRPIETPFELEDVVAMAQPEWTEEGLVAASMANRSEIKAIQYQVSALENIQRAQEGGLKPSLSVSATHTRNIDAQGFSARDSSTTGVLSIAFPLFDSGITRAKVNQARQDVVQAKTPLDQITLGISLEVRQAISSLINAKARLDVAEKQVTLAQETYDIAALRDKVGEGIALQVIDAQTELTRARTGLVTARYDYLKAFAALQRAIGADDLQAKPVEKEKE